MLRFIKNFIKEYRRKREIEGFKKLLIQLEQGDIW